MKIKSIELIEINLPLVHFFETSFGRTYKRRIILICVRDAHGGAGWGEVTCGETPSYNEEWTDAAWVTIEKILAPMIVGQEIKSASQIWGLMKPVRGNRMAKAAIETAVWDLEAKNLDVPLWKHLGGTNREIVCGVSIGIQDSVEQLFEKIETELNAGYKRIKIKIAPHWDYEIIKQVRKRFGDKFLLMGDANSAYTLDDVELFKEMDKFNLMMFEQPLAYDDIFDHAKLQQEIKTPICLDESIHSLPDARKAIKIGACRIINLKLGRVGGHKQAKRISNFCRVRDIPVWCGGMLESGIGRAHNVAMSTLKGFTLPGDVSASKRYWHEDIIEPAIDITARGTIIAPEKAGIGYEVKHDRIERLAVRKKKI